MSEVSEVPTLGLGRDQFHLWTQVVMTLAGKVRERRLLEGRAAWSDPEDVARQHDHELRAAAPPVRTITEGERRILGSLPTDQMSVDGRRGQAGDGSVVEVRVDRVGDRWVLRARGSGTDGSLADAAVSCISAEQASLLADELLGSGVQRVATLAEFGEVAAVRAREAARDLAEPEEEQLARVADVIRDRWAPSLADRVVSNEAFGALAGRLHQLEGRGHDLASVLERLDTAALQRPHVRNPAALAEHLARELLHEFVDDQSAMSNPVRGAMSNLVRGALPGPVAEKVLDCPTWPKLADRLEQWQREGRVLPEMLAALPAGRVFGARVPAAYVARLLATAVSGPRNGRGSTAAPPPRSSTDRQRLSPGPRSPSPPPADGKAIDDHMTVDGQVVVEGQVVVDGPVGIDPSTLDPTSAVDRVALEALSSAYETAINPPQHQPVPAPAPAVLTSPGRRGADESPGRRDEPLKGRVEQVRGAGVAAGPAVEAAARAAAACTPPESPRPSPRPRPTPRAARPAAPSVTPRTDPPRVTR